MYVDIIDPTTFYLSRLHCPHCKSNSNFTKKNKINCKGEKRTVKNSAKNYKGVRLINHILKYKCFN